MTQIQNPFDLENQNLHSYIPRSRVGLIESLLYYLRTKKGIFKVYAETGNGGSFVISQVYKLLKAHENVFYLDGKKVKDVKAFLKAELNLKDVEDINKVAETIKELNIKGKHSIFILEHFERFNQDDFIYLTDIIKKINGVKLVIIGNYDKVDILSKNLKIPLAYTVKLKRLSFIESCKYLYYRYKNMNPIKPISKIVHLKAILFIAFVSHGKPQILNKIANASMMDAIKKNNLPLSFRQALVAVFKYRMITYPYFPIHWGITFGVLVFLIISYLFYLPISHSVQKFNEERLKQLIDRDVKRLNLDEPKFEIPEEEKSEGNL